MGDFFKKLDEFMTSDLVRKIGGLVCLVALVLIAAGFLVGAKSVLKTLKPSVVVDAADEEGTAEDAEDDEEEMEDDADEEEDDEEEEE